MERLQGLLRLSSASCHLSCSAAHLQDRRHEGPWHDFAIAYPAAAACDVVSADAQRFFTDVPGRAHGDKEVRVSEWRQHPVVGRLREVSFVSAVKRTMGISPPFAHCHQTQRYRRCAPLSIASSAHPVFMPTFLGACPIACYMIGREEVMNNFPQVRLQGSILSLEVRSLPKQGIFCTAAQGCGGSMQVFFTSHCSAHLSIIVTL